MAAAASVVTVVVIVVVFEVRVSSGLLAPVMCLVVLHRGPCLPEVACPAFFY